MTGKFEMGKQNPGIPKVLRSRRERPRTCKRMSPKLAPFPHTLVVQVRVDCNSNQLGPVSRESLRGCPGPRLLLAWGTMIPPTHTVQTVAVDRCKGGSQRKDTPTPHGQES